MSKKESSRPVVSAGSIEAPEIPAKAPAVVDRIPPYNPDFEWQMKLAEDIMHEDREILRTLAKWNDGAGHAICPA